MVPNDNPIITQYITINRYYTLILPCLFIILIGGWPTPLKNMSSSVGMILPNYWGKQKPCSKPPTSIYIYIYQWDTGYPDTLQKICFIIICRIRITRPFGGGHPIFKQTHIIRYIVPDPFVLPKGPILPMFAGLNGSEWVYACAQKWWTQPKTAINI